MYEISSDEFERVPLRVHSFLAGVPLRSLYRVDLPGGRGGMKLQEINDITGFGGESEVEVGAVTKALFDLRGLIGRIFGWDEVPALADSATYLSRLSEEDRARSLVKPGTVLGISRVLYRFENELLAEIVNRTVHCFWVMASEKSANGYALYLAIYVKKLNWFTPVYMALITPMVKWIIYPSMIKGVQRRWEQAFPLKSDEQSAMRNEGQRKRKGRWQKAVPLLLLLWAYQVSQSPAQEHALHQKSHDTKRGKIMEFRIPQSLKAEHEELHAELAKATREGGKVGDAAKAVANLMHPHFIKEEEYAMPPLGLLPLLAEGKATPEMASVLAMTDKLKAEHHQMLQEHKAIVAALEKLVAAAKMENKTEYARFAEKLMLHAQNEEEVLYPAAILVGEHLKLILKK